MKQIRTRFAPSPTGALHAGTVRTALFAWLVAKHGNGKFILRIEDTDQARSIEGGVDNIINSLRFVGIDWDEGPDQPADDGPFIQSERLDKYTNYANQLVQAGLAYADPYSIIELDKLRNEAKEKHQPFLYRNHRPENPPAWDGSQPLRLKSTPKAYEWHDIVMGNMGAGAEAIDDFVIIKSDGFPTYNFAHIVDDLLMNITHVIRSQEFISSMPKFLNLYDALNIERPIFATLPPVLNDNGKRKLSKREGAKQILEYKTMGVMPEALMNFLATLGWNDGTTEEIFSKEDLINKFDLSRVQKGGAQFNESQLIFMNGVHIRNLDLENLFERVKDFWPESALNFDESYRKKVLKLIQERLKYFSEVPELSNFFFEDLPINDDLIKTNKNLKNLSQEELISLLNKSKQAIDASSFNLGDLVSRLNDLLVETDQKPATLFSLIRIATTQAISSPGLAETLEVLGKEVTIKRINKQIDAL
jgi:glutamyl-tRNA synthetase